MGPPTTHVSIDEDNTTHQEPSANEPSHYVEAMELGAQGQHDSYSQELSTKELKDAELQIKQLEMELDNTLDTDVGEEEPTAVKVPKTYEFSETSKTEKLLTVVVQGVSCECAGWSYLTQT